MTQTSIDTLVQAVREKLNDALAAGELVIPAGQEKSMAEQLAQEVVRALKPKEEQ